MSAAPAMQRVIFRPAAVQRYVQGEREWDEPLAVTPPAAAGWYVLIVVCVLIAVAALFIPFQQHSVASLSFSDTAAESVSALETRE